MQQIYIRESVHDISSIFDHAIESTIDFGVFSNGFQVVATKTQHFFEQFHDGQLIIN